MSDPKSNNYSDKKPVLIVEDNHVNRQLFSFQLRHFGLASQYATNGREAVDLIEADPHSFSLILMDLQMPVMDGVTATQLIRQKEANTDRHIIIVALTANDSTGIYEQCIAAGMDDFVNKPSTLAKLGETLGKWLKDS
jgi:two-component system sensor histidine kinase/response regulator